MKTTTLQKWGLYGAITLGALLSLFPLYWMFIIGTNTHATVNRFPPVLIPGDRFFLNFESALSRINFWSAMQNSFIVAIVTTCLVLFFCSLAGFAFAKFQFPLRRLLFLGILFTLAVPIQLKLIPSYLIIVDLGLLDTLTALIFPNLVSAFGIFWMNQYIAAAVPDELMESARIDGCSNFRIYWNIVCPTILPAFATLGILTFLHSWNDFMWPLIVLKSADNFTLQVALRGLFSMPQERDYAQIMSATFVATLPLIVMFLLFRRWFIDSLTAGAVKG